MNRNFSLLYDVDEGMSGFGGVLQVQADSIEEAMAKAKHDLLSKYNLSTSAEIRITRG